MVKKRAFGIWCFVISYLLISSFSSAQKPRLLSVQKIWDKGNHNAFTDLARFKGKFFCTFREAKAHVGGDGELRVLVSKDGKNWKSAALLREQGVDLRDPKLCVTPDDRLMIVAGGSVYNGTRKLKSRQPRVAFSKDGSTWTQTKRVLSEGDWLWRVTWHKGIAYGTSYRTKPRKLAEKNHNWSLSLYQSKDGEHYRRIADLEVSGRPNETTLRFLPEGTMVALTRREGGNKVGWIGQSKPPYQKWSWHQTKHRLGGPNFIRLPNGQLWAASRAHPGGSKNVLAKMTPTSFEPVFTLPSGGDTSYPGLVWHDETLWMSYYSSHEGKTSIYIAKFQFDTK